MIKIRVKKHTSVNLWFCYDCNYYLDWGGKPTSSIDGAASFNSINDAISFCAHHGHVPEFDFELREPITKDEIKNHPLTFDLKNKIYDEIVSHIIINHRKLNDFSTKERYSAHFLGHSISHLESESYCMDRVDTFKNKLREIILNTKD